MINTAAIDQVRNAHNIAAARELTMRILFAGLSNDDRKSQIRSKVNQTGTVKQLVEYLWAQKLNQEGLRLPGTVKARRGMAWSR